MQKQPGRVIAGGMGGFLNPPGHPEHCFHVEFDLKRKKENRGGTSLSSAVDWEHFDAATRRAARKKLAEWKPPLIGSKEIQEWILQVLGYFKNCYRNPVVNEPECWHAGKMVITENPENVGLDPVGDHAGIHHVRKWYPDFTPTREQMLRAYWGKKPA